MFSSLSFFGIGAVAQDDRSEESRAQHHLSKLGEDLDMNDKQIEQLSLIMESQREERDNAHKKHQAAREEMHTLQISFRNQIAGVLSTEQLEQFDRQEDRRKSRHNNEVKHNNRGDGSKYQGE